MENKMHENIFETTFDSFELNDGFLSKVDDVLKKHNINTTDYEKKSNKITINKSDFFCEKNKVDKKMQFEDLSLFLEDLNESDFFEQTKSKNIKNSKVTNNVPKTKEKAELCSNKTITSLSPILLSKSKNKISKSFTSTPLKSNNLSPGEKKKTEKSEENCVEISDYAYLEADLFDDWGVEVNSQKDSITLSQAFKLIEEVESAGHSNHKDLNTSVDLLTGRPIGADDVFDESFSLPPDLLESKRKQDDHIILAEESNSVSKPSVAQRLNFNTKTEKKNSFKIDFNSDDDFDFLTQELLNKPKCVKTVTQVKGFSADESSESIKKGRKCCRIIESDSADESPDLKLSKNCTKKIRRQKTCEMNAAKEFIESEAEVSDTVAVSSDESEREGDYDFSFVDEELYLTQNCSVDMTAKYLESVKDSDRPGQFKIPAAKPYNPAFVFSQIAVDNNTEYELDSFCVSEVEEETKTDLSDLEIAENILEMDRKKKKRKRSFK